MRPHRVLAALLLLAPLAAHAQYSIDSVTYNHAGPYTTPELAAVSGLEAGQLLTQNSLGNAAQHLLDTGLFSDATIDYTGTGMRRGLVVDLKPIPLDKLLPASFENFVWFTPEELTAGIHAHVPLYRGVASDAGTLPDDIQSALQQMLAAKGITATLSHEIVEPTNTPPATHRQLQSRLSPASSSPKPTSPESPKRFSPTPSNSCTASKAPATTKASPASPSKTSSSSPHAPPAISTPNSRTSSAPSRPPPPASP